SSGGSRWSSGGLRWSSGGLRWSSGRGGPTDKPPYSPPPSVRVCRLAAAVPPMSGNDTRAAAVFSGRIQLGTLTRVRLLVAVLRLDGEAEAADAAWAEPPSFDVSARCGIGMPHIHGGSETRTVSSFL